LDLRLRKLIFPHKYQEEKEVEKKPVKETASGAGAKESKAALTDSELF